MRRVVFLVYALLLASCSSPTVNKIVTCGCAHPYISPDSEEYLAQHVNTFILFPKNSSILAGNSDSKRIALNLGVPPAQFGSMKMRADRLAKWLLTHPKIKILIAGNTDEHGSEAYNLALGQRRADVVRDYFVGKGVAPERLKTISYGKDRPFTQGHDEATWQANRVAIISVQGQNMQACLGEKDAFYKSIDYCHQQK